MADTSTRGEDAILKTMYERWPFFQSTLDLIEMVLAKADSRIAAEYDRRLVPPDLRPLGVDLRSRLARATAAVLSISGHRQPADATPVLRRSIDAATLMSIRQPRSTSCSLGCVGRTTRSPKAFADGQWHRGGHENTG